MLKNMEAYGDHLQNKILGLFGVSASLLTLPAGNFLRNSGVRLVWPKWKWGGAESTRT